MRTETMQKMLVLISKSDCRHKVLIFGKDASGTGGQLILPITFVHPFTISKCIECSMDR